MVKRPVFTSTTKENGYVLIRNIEFDWFPGFSIKQKQRSIESLHNNYKEIYPHSNILEVSSKSNIELGVELSAFNLMIKTKTNKEFSVETAFQASKVFETGGPFMDLYEKTSMDAKKDPRIKNSGKLLYFQFFGRRWELDPKTFFYDWLYINALSLNPELSKKVMQYDAFTDIEFNPKKSINCQANAIALYVSLNKMDVLDEALTSIEKFKELLFGKQNDSDIDKKEKDDREETKQLSIFDSVE